MSSPRPLLKTVLRFDSRGFFPAVASGILLFLSYPDFNLFLLEWIAFLPLLWALESGSLRRAYMLGVVTGLTATCGGFYWIAHWSASAMELAFPFNLLTMVGHNFYAAQAFGIVTFCYRWCHRRHLPLEPLLLPVIWVSVMPLFPMIFRFTLGDGQASAPLVLQPIEFTGVYGLDFVLILVNSLIYKIIQTDRPKTRLQTVSVTILLAAVWFGYGAVTIDRWQSRMESWESKRIGIVQPNRPVSLTRPQPEKGYSRLFPLEMTLTRRLIPEQPDLVIWPEGHFFGYTFWTEVKTAFSRQIREMGVPVIIFDVTRRQQPSGPDHYNTSIAIAENGETVGLYHKMKLVPFGEYTPIPETFPLLRTLLGDYLEQLAVGKQHKVFPLAGMKIVPKICYEPLFPELVAEAVAPAAAGAVLVVQSQDGWFGDTSMPAQHTAATVLRAVENRIPVIHVINNGPSSVILPDGRLAFQSTRFTRGSWMAEMPYHDQSGGSFFTRHPGWFINLIRCLFIVLLICTFRAPSAVNPSS